MSRVMVKGVVVRLTRRSRQAENPDGMLVLIDQGTTAYVPLPAGAPAPTVGETVEGWTTLDCVADALAQAGRKSRDTWRGRCPSGVALTTDAQPESRPRPQAKLRSIQPPARPAEARSLSHHLTRSLLPLWPHDAGNDASNPPKD